MAFEVSGLTAYVEENIDQLVSESLFEATTQKLILAQGNVMTGVKGSETINRLDTDVIFQDDSDCGFNASGTTEFTQRTLTVGKIKVQEQFCPKKLEGKYTQKALPAGSTYDTMVFAKDFTDLKAGKIAEALETAIWSASTAGGSGSNGLLNKFDGIKRLITVAGGTVVNANAAAYYTGAPETTIDTATKAKNAVLAVIKALPSKIAGKDDVRIFVGFNVYSLLVQAYVDANLYHFAPGVNANDFNSEFIVPGYNYRVVPVHGLDSDAADAAIYAFRMSNIFLGTDLQNEEEVFRMWYSEDDMVIKFHAAFKLGVQFAFMDEIVKFEA